MPERAGVGVPSRLAVLLDEFGRTEPARVCADPVGAYANCLALSAQCAEWLRERGVACGVLRHSGSRATFPDGSGRWPFVDPREIRHWTVRVGPWSIDWSARQFRPQADWPDVMPVDSLRAAWGLTEDWACPRCPVLVAHPRHRELTPNGLERAHRQIARATRGRGPFGDPRHDDTPGLAVLCACDAEPPASVPHVPADQPPMTGSLPSPGGVPRTG
jgi:hypothetical protein